MTRADAKNKRIVLVTCPFSCGRAEDCARGRRQTPSRMRERFLKPRGIVLYMEREAREDARVSAGDQELAQAIIRLGKTSKATAQLRGSGIHRPADHFRLARLSFLVKQERRAAGQIEFLIHIAEKP